MLKYNLKMREILFVILMYGASIYLKVLIFVEETEKNFIMAEGKHSRHLNR